jgi:prepilin-type N-terminal cleavage/methylation domain-containing protein
MADHAILTPKDVSAWGEPMLPIRKRFSLRSTRGEKGFTLIEVIIAMALLAIVAVAILSGLSTGSRAIFVADERATAESLARTEMEYVKNQDYSDGPWAYKLPSGTPPADPPTWWNPANPPALPAGYDGYSVDVRADPLPSQGTDIQKITVTVGHHDKPDVITLEGYKVNR